MRRRRIPHLNSPLFTLSQQVQTPLHDLSIFQIDPRHPAAHRAGQAPPRTARRGPRISSWSARQSPASPRFCRLRQNAWTPHPRRLTALRSQQVQAPLHDLSIFQIDPRHPAAHRAGQAPPRTARRGPRISSWSARQSPASPRFCRLRQNAWTPHPRRLTALRSQQVQALSLIHI